MFARHGACAPRASLERRGIAMPRARSDTRSYAAITRADFRRLARIAREEREDFFSRHPEWALLYRKRLLCSALCRDAALHLLNGAAGVQSFDVWSFYAEHPEAAYPHHLSSRRDFGRSKFGPDPNSSAYTGRRVDLSGRSLRCQPDDNPVDVLLRYLQRGATPSARDLRRQAVVLIEPEPYMGYVVWPTLVSAPSR
jgi:hypothetical protein